jgi:hypothetical protein
MLINRDMFWHEYSLNGKIKVNKITEQNHSDAYSLITQSLNTISNKSLSLQIEGDKWTQWWWELYIWCAIFNPTDQYILFHLDADKYINKTLILSSIHLIHSLSPID